ncbi:MAG: hypothetical protein DA407_17255 [Bacteroidetes bacterium]|nr:MAG: hypothetical protein DA407_17255 [Bacteroidota bacterium]
MNFNFFRTHFNHRRTNQILIILLSLDVLFIFTHALLIYLIYIRIQFDWSLADLFMINNDNGYPEVFQYFKYFIVILILFYLIIKKQGIGYIAWLLLFILLLLDDSMRLHEGFGTWAVEKFNYSPMFGLRAHDLGELTYVAFFGSILLFFLVFGYLKGDSKHRKINIDLGLLFALFLFFGVAMDMIDQLFEYNRYSHLILVLIEDGGEMITLSLLVWYFFHLLLKPKEHDVYLFENYLKKNSK